MDVLCHWNWHVGLGGKQLSTETRVLDDATGEAEVG